MKNLVDFINESLNREQYEINERGPAPIHIDNMLRNLKNLIPKTEWDKCDSLKVDEVLQLIVDTLENYEEKTSVRLTELDVFNKMRKYDTVFVASHDNQASDVVDKLASFVDKKYLFAKKSYHVFNGQNVNVYFEEFNDIMIGGMDEYQNESEHLWTFFIATDDI